MSITYLSFLGISFDILTIKALFLINKTMLFRIKEML